MTICVQMTRQEADALIDAWHGDPDAYAGTRARFTDSAILKIGNALEQSCKCVITNDICPCHGKRAKK